MTPVNLSVQGNQCDQMTKSRLAQLFPNVAQNVATSVFTEIITFSKIAHKLQKVRSNATELGSKVTVLLRRKMFQKSFELL